MNSARFITSVKPEEYLALIKNSVGLLGNSSSGLIEAPSLHVPTINIGDRQKGRVRGTSVIDCVCTIDDISKSIFMSQDRDFINKIGQASNPYYKKSVCDTATYLIKRFLLSSASGYKDFYDFT
ncbi:Polysialic acid biosynthesis protein P7 [compost metagenome]